MPKTNNPDAELLDRLESSLADDLLTDAYSDAEIASILRNAGGDAAAIARGGAELGKALQEQARSAWRSRAQAKQDRMKAVLAKAKSFVGRPISEVREYVRAAQADPALAGAFHKRSANSSSEEELRSLAEDVERLRILAGDETNSDDDT